MTMKILGFLATAILVVLSVVALWLMVYGYRLLTEEDLSLTDKAAGVQALAATVSLLATILLVSVTAWYAWITGRLLHQSGPVISVEFSVGWISQPVGQGGVLLGPLSSLKSGPPDDRFLVPLLAVQIRNSGNMAASIARVSVESKGSFFYTHIVAPAGPSCPFELGAHSHQTAFISVEDVITAINAWNEVMGKSSLAIRAVVELGSGAIEYSGWEQLPSN